MDKTMVQTTLEWSFSWVALLMFSAMIAEGIHGTTDNVDAKQITLALSCSWLAVVLMPTADTGRQPKMLLWATMAAAGFLILTMSPLVSQGESSIRIAGGVLVLVCFYSSIVRLIRCFTSNDTSAMALFTIIAGVCCAAPLFMGVVAEAVMHQTLVADAIIAISPISYLAASAGYDYLHNNWFYQNTPFGGLRFSYPDPAVLTFLYVITFLAMAGASSYMNKLKARKQK